MLEYIQVVLVAIICSGPVGIGLNYIFRFFKNNFNYIPIVGRAALGALGAFAIAVFMWFWLGIEPTHILGMGEDTIEHVLVGGGNPQLHVWWVLLLVILAKSIATGMTLMTGGSAGLLVPAMVLGGCMWCVAYVDAAIFTYALNRARVICGIRYCECLGCYYRSAHLGSVVGCIDVW